MNKKYKASSDLTVVYNPFDKSNTRYINFPAPYFEYDTSDEDEQSFLESLGYIECLSDDAAEAKDDDGVGSGSQSFDKKEFPDVTDMSEARSILKAEPYNIAHSKLIKPQSVLNQAEKFNVSFPNLIID